jgi:hypothetical protein
MRGDQSVDAIKRNRPHVDRYGRSATMFDQIAFDEDLAQGLVIRQHRNDRVAAKSIGRGRGNVGAGPFEFVQRFGRLVPCTHPVPCLQQVRRHDLAHPACAEKSYLHRFHPLAARAVGGHS